MKTFTSIILAVLVGLAAGCAKTDHAAATDSKTSNSPTKLTFKLHWIPDAHQLGFWVALDKGFYRNHGIDLSMYPGGMDANPIRDVVNGSADVGQVGGIEQVVLANSEGLPVKAIATIHRRTPHALISLRSRPIEKASDFQGKTIAVAFGDTAEILLKSYMDAQGVAPSSVRMVPYRYDLTPLLLGQVDAVTGFSTGQPVTIKEKGQEPVVLAYDSAGVRSYGYTIVTTPKIMAEKAAALKQFLAASREGWKYAFAHPDESAELFKKRFGTAVEVERTKAELNLLRSIMLDDKGEVAGWSTDEKIVAGVKDMLVKYSGAKKDVSPASVFDNSFLND